MCIRDRYDSVYFGCIFCKQWRQPKYKSYSSKEKCFFFLAFFTLPSVSYILPYVRFDSQKGFFSVSARFLSSLSRFWTRFLQITQYQGKEINTWCRVSWIFYVSADNSRIMQHRHRENFPSSSSCFRMHRKLSCGIVRCNSKDDFYTAHVFI